MNTSREDLIGAIYNSRLAACITLTALVLGSILSGCAAVESRELKDSSPGVGIIYHLPLRPVLVTITPNADPSKVAFVVTQGDPEPDLSSSFAMTFPANWLGNTHPNVATDSQGLLTSVGSTVTSGVDEIAKSLGTIAGDISAIAKATGTDHSATPTSTCKDGQAYTKVLHVKDTAEVQLCTYTVKIASLAVEDKQKLPGDASTNQNSVGVFYRLAQPYKVTIAAGKNESGREFVVYAPDASKTYFQPIPRTFFGSSTAILTFDHGILTSYNNTISGEAVAAAKLPADIIEAYFTAIGSMFSSLGTKDTNEKALLESQTALAVQKLKVQACQSAIAAHKATDPMDSVTAVCEN